MPLNRTAREYERLLAVVFGLLIQCGVSQRAISTLTTRALKTALANSRALGRSGSGELTVISLVLDAWHRNRRYLTSRGKPKPVPLLGAAPSVEALIKSETHGTDAVTLAHRIQSLRLIARCSGNRYTPTSDSALIAIYDPTVLQYVARSLMSLLGTVEDNLARASNPSRLLERAAEVPDLPVECIRPFREFSRLQGQIFTRTINDWLQMRRAKAPLSGKRKIVRAGVHVHAYLVPRAPQLRASTTKRSLA